MKWWMVWIGSSLTEITGQQSKGDQPREKVQNWAGNQNRADDLTGKIAGKPSETEQAKQSTPKLDGFINWRG